NSVVEDDPAVNCSNKIRLRGVDVPIVFFVLERRPERFGWTVVPTYPGRTHRPAQPVPEARGRGQMGGVFPASVRMQDRPTTPAAPCGRGPIYGLADHVGADMISDAVSQHFS